MNKKVLKFITLGIGCGSGLVALFNLISAIVLLTGIDAENPALYNVGLILISVISLAAACGFGLLCYANVMAFIGDKESKYNKYPVSLYGVVIALIQLVLMIFSHGYESALCYVLLVLALSVIILFVLSLVNEDKNTARILLIVSAGIAFVLSCVNMSNNGGWGFACDLFTMITISGVIGYLVCNLIIENNGNNTKSENKKEEPKEETNTIDKTESE